MNEKKVPELTAADVNWKVRVAEQIEAGGESDAERRRRRQMARLVRRIGGWLSGCWPANDEDVRQSCSRCEYRRKALENEDDGTAGCEGIEEAMVPLVVLDELRELLTLVREDLTR